MLDKPILLDISAVWCHWCHVMDQTTYLDTEVAKLVEEKTVPVRVDTDKRPDINKRYNMGGWPTTAFLTPEGEVISGATYIPPKEMKQLLLEIEDFYKKNKDKFKARLEELKSETLKPPSMKYGLEEEFFHSVIDNLILEITSNFDSAHGGFGTAPKFPHSDVLGLALLEYKIRGHMALLNIVTKTLQKMSAGGIYDQEEGGFFRYSTTMDWSLPHFEKMCEDNAKLLTNYLEAYQVTGEAKFKETAQKILRYIETYLSDHKDGGFYGSQDADEEYYKLSLRERRKRTPPKVDKTLYTNYNALMATARLLASVVLENPNNQNFALRTIDVLLEHSFSSRKGMYHYYSDGKRHLPGLLTDQAHMMKCLINAYEATADRKFLNCAENIAQFTLTNLWDNEGGFYDRPKSEALGALQERVKSLDENSVAADAFLRLHSLTGRDNYREVAKKTLNYFASTYQRQGIMAAGYGLALELYLLPVQVHIVGSRTDPLTRKFQTESLRAYNPLKTIEVLDPEVDTARLASLRYPVSEVPRAYVCFKGTCTLVEDSREVASKIAPTES